MGIDTGTLEGIAGASFAMAVWVAMTMLDLTEKEAYWLLFETP